MVISTDLFLLLVCFHLSNSGVSSFRMPLYVKQQERNINNNTITNTMVNATAVGTAGKVVHSNSKQYKQQQQQRRQQPLQHQHHQQHRCRAAHVKQAFKHEPSYPHLLSPPSRYCENIFRRLMSLCFILLVVLVRKSACNFINQVAVHIEGGVQNADRVAKEHGFKNLGQVSKSDIDYLFIFCFDSGSVIYKHMFVL